MSSQKTFQVFFIYSNETLVNSDDTLKLCDFGFARKITEGQRLTDYVATRWYRSPDLLLTDKYGKPSDIWAAGCIMGEQTDGKPLFPGKDQIDQLHLIMKVLGPLTPELKELFSKNPDFAGINFPDSKRFQTLDVRYKNKVEGKALSFQKGTLTMSPSDRLTAEECLQHPYFEDLRTRDPELAELNKAFIENRIESTKCTDGGQDTRMTSSTTNNQVNKIRIKTLNEKHYNNSIPQNSNSIPQQERKSIGQSVERSIGNNQIVFSDHDINKASKTYYNLHMQNSQFESTKQHTKQEQIKQKNYQVYGNFKANEDQQRQTIQQVKRQNMGKYQFENSINFEPNTKHNNTGSLSQFQKKYNFTSTTKFASQDKKINGTQGLGVFKGGLTNTNGFTKYDNQYGTNSFIKQLPTLNKKAFFSNSNAFPNNPESMQYKESKKYPAQIKAQNISKTNMNDLHSMQIRRKQPSKGVNSHSLNKNVMNASSNKFGFKPIMNNLF